MDVQTARSSALALEYVPFTFKNLCSVLVDLLARLLDVWFRRTRYRDSQWD